MATLKLYHAPISTCSQKVRLALAEKELEFESVTLDLVAGDQHQPEYRALNPKAVIPTLVDGDLVLIESTLINEYLDEAYPKPRLRPKSASERHSMRRWTYLVDEQLHPACRVVTSAIAVRPAQQRLPRERVLANIAKTPDPFQREMRTSVFEQGVDSPYFERALRSYAGVLDELDRALTGRETLVGDDVSLADLALVPYVLRLDHLGYGHLWQNGRRPHLTRWYESLHSRSAYDAAVRAWEVAQAVEGMHAAGSAALARVDEILGRH